MKADVRFPDRWCRGLTTAFVLALALGPSIAFAEGGVVDQTIDAAFNLRDQLQQVVTKSVKGVGEAMQEGPPPDNNGSPWTLDDLKQIQQKHADLLNRNKTLAQQQQQLADLDAQLLRKLPPDDPRRAALSAELKQIASQIPETHKQVQNFTNKLAEANGAIDKFRQNHDPTYVPPKTTTAAPPAPPDAPAEPPPPPPAEPPKTDDGGSTDNGLSALKQKEAAQEAAARELGQQRQSAVNTYLDDPTSENRAAAEALRQQLDGMVDDLNGIRGQVDVLEGTSRTPLHVRSAKAIAEEHRRRRISGTNTDGSETNQGGGCAGPISGSEQHNPDGSDASGVYQDVAPGGSGNGSGSGSGSGGVRTQHLRGGMPRTLQSSAVSSQNHHHASDGMNVSHHQTMSQNGSRRPNQQTASQNKNRQPNQQTASQNKYHQQRKRQANGQ